MKLSRHARLRCPAGPKQERPYFYLYIPIKEIAMIAGA